MSILSAGLPEILDPLVTNHPASAAYGVEHSSWGTTLAEREAIARALVALDRWRQTFYQDNGGGTATWALEAGKQS